MIRGVYTLLFYLLVPLVLLRLMWRGLRAPAYRRRWSERFGFCPGAGARSSIWVHAVSVGETQAALPLVRDLLRRYPEHALVLTTTTPTGSRRAREALGERVVHSYLPYDLPPVLRRFLNRARPVLLVVMETELWPNLYRACRRRRIPLVVANARLSQRSMKRYRWLSPLVRDTLDDVSLIAAQSDADAERFMALGALPGRVRNLGNLKFDLEIPDARRREGLELRRKLGEQRPVLAAVSTHRGEDEQVLEAFATVRESVPDALLVLVPRHPERFAEVGRLCAERGWGTVARSRSGTDSAIGSGARVDIYLGDTMGDMVVLLAAADVVFVGGSLVPVGGHNVLEPAALGLPVCFGPHMHNFREARDRLFEAGAGWRVGGADDLAEWALMLFDNPGLRQLAGAAGRRVVAANRGTLERLSAELSRLLKEEQSA
jgi:3-deoxy-D-manno-octulosonic-acid transferase